MTSDLSTCRSSVSRTGDVFQYTFPTTALVRKIMTVRAPSDSVSNRTLCAISDRLLVRSSKSLAFGRFTGADRESSPRKCAIKAWAFVGQKTGRFARTDLPPRTPRFPSSTATRSSSKPYRISFATVRSPSTSSASSARPERRPLRPRPGGRRRQPNLEPRARLRLARSR